MQPRIRRVLAYVRRHGLAATSIEATRRLVHRLTAGELPGSVHLEISNCCNLHCEYCVLDENAEGDKIMRDKTFEVVLPTLRHARRIDLSGLAEPLMNKRFVPMLAQVRSHAPHAYVSMCTNATLLTPQIAEKIVEYGLDEVVFSLDGIDPAAVDAVRRGGSLDTVLANIRMLQQTKVRMGATKPVVNATVVLQHKNLATLPDVVELAAELGCVGVSVNGLEPYEESLVAETLWIAPDAALINTIERAGEAAARLGVDLRLPALQPQAPVCPQVSRPIVLADGTVVPCSVLAYHRPSLLAIDGDGEVQHRKTQVERLVFGNVNDNGLEAVWTSDAYRAFRRDVSAGRFPHHCAACLMKHAVVCPTPPLTAEQSIATAPASAAAGTASKPTPVPEARS